VPNIPTAVSKKKKGFFGGGGGKKAAQQQQEEEAAAEAARAAAASTTVEVHVVNEEAGSQVSNMAASAAQVGRDGSSLSSLLMLSVQVITGSATGRSDLFLKPSLFLRPLACLSALPSFCLSSLFLPAVCGHS
jgi:hypothetical protein